MTRNLKALGLALLAICAFGALAAQGASAALEHEFHSAVANTIVTGKNIEGKEKFAVGAAGTVECNKSIFEAQQTGTEVSANTFQSDTLTVTPRYEECTFGGQPATVSFNHCAYVFDSDTGETEPEKEVKTQHANVEVECGKNEKEEVSRIEIDTSVCTITIGPQVVKHAVKYEADGSNESAIKIKSTATKVVTGKVKTTESQTGCLLFPTGAIGTYTGVATSECFKDEGSLLTGTEKTTPKGLTKEGATAKCAVTNLP